MKNKIENRFNYNENKTRTYFVKLNDFGKIGFRNRQKELVILEDGTEIELCDDDIKFLNALNLNTDIILKEKY